MQVYRFLIFFLIVVTYIDSTVTTGNDQAYTICNTDECVNTAAKVRNKLNLTVDPCDNFYQFACGGWVARNPLGPSQLHIAMFDQLYNNVLKKIKAILEDTQKPDDTVAIRYAREIYNMCMNNDKSGSDGIAALDTFIQRFGAWPITLPLSEWNTDNVSWQEMISKIHDNSFENGLFFVGIRTHSKKSDTHVIYVTQPYLFTFRKTYENLDNNTLKKEEYIKSIKTVAQAFVEKRGSNVDEEMIAQDALDIVDFEINLAKRTKNREEIMELSVKHIFPTLEEWQQTYDSYVTNSEKTTLDWRNLLQRTFEPVGITILPSDIIMTPTWSFFSDLVSLLEQTDIRTIVNYIQWAFIREQIDYTTIQLEKLANHIKKELLGEDEPKSRWAACVEVPNLGTAISYEYAKKYVQNENKENVEQIITDIADVVREQISTSTWMDESTRSVSIDKLNHMRFLVSTPDWYTKEAIDKLYENLTITSGYLETVLNVQADERHRLLSDLRKPVNKDKWPFEPTTAEAFYLPNSNAIQIYKNHVKYPANLFVVITAAIMQDPIYNATRPMGMNYASIGGVVGHEINHGFDNFGRNFDKDGNVLDWWTPETIDNYKINITQCFIDQYNNYEVPGLNETIWVNGAASVGENVGDSAGVAAAFKAYKNRKAQPENGKAQSEIRLPGLEEYSEDQIYFMSYAQMLCENISPEKISILLSDEHPRTETRVRGGLSNLAAFSKAYQCSDNAKMNPINKCSLWQ